MATYINPEYIAWCDCAGRVTHDHHSGYYLSEDYEVTPVTLQMRYDLHLISDEVYNRLKAIQGTDDYPRPAILRKEGSI